MRWVKQNNNELSIGIVAAITAAATVFPNANDCKRENKNQRNHDKNAIGMIDARLLRRNSIWANQTRPSKPDNGATWYIPNEQYNFYLEIQDGKMAMLCCSD